MKVQIAKKIKITHHTVLGDGWIGEGISLMNPCCVSQQVFCQVLNAVEVMVCFKKKYLMEK